MLTARNIRDVATGEWSRYFNWRVPPKCKSLFFVSLSLFAVYLILLAIAGMATPHDTTETQIIPSGNEIISVHTGYYGGFVAAYQDDNLLPTLAVVGADNSSAIRDTLQLMSICILLVAGLLLIFWMSKYTDTKRDFIDSCEQDWIDSEFKDIPNQQSVIDFITKEK
jgi:hypothetical protein